MKRSLNVIVLAATSLLILALGVFKPFYNWDMIGYVASAHYMDGLRGEELSKLTYEDIRKEVGDVFFNSLVEGDYRHTVFSDHQSLEQQLPFYTIRVGYVGAARLLNKFGLGYPKSTYIISAFFAFGSALLVGLLCNFLGVSILWTPIILVSNGFTSISRLSTPDAMACFFALLTVYMILKNSRYCLLLAVILPLLRTDFVILSMLVAVYKFLSGVRGLSIVSALASLGLYAFINKSMGNYGWLTIFNFTLIGISPYPRDMVISTNPVNYLKPYLSSAYAMLMHSHGVIYVIGIFCFINRIFNSVSTEARAALFISYLFVAAHLILFPAYMDRFFTFAATTIFVITLSAISKIHTVKHLKVSVD